MRLRQKLRATRKGAGKTVSRFAPALVTAAMAGAASGMFDGDSASANCLPRTGGAVVEAWAFGPLTGAAQPNSTAPCDLKHLCDIVVASSGGAPGVGVQIK